MKKTQKKLGNKGFSLVELIVVIAIMAVLVGVLAPTLIKNIEKSRESKDAQNIEQIKSSVEIALQNETAYAHNVPTGDTPKTLVTIDSSTNATDVVIATDAGTDFTTEFNGQINTDKTKLTSKKYKALTITITVDKKGQVDVTETPKTTTP